MNRSNAVIPFYVQAAETLRRRIATGEYPEGSVLPPTEELEREFGVSNVTIQKALTLLSDEGMVHRRRGLGTVVARYPGDLVTIELSGSSDRLLSFVESLPPELEVLEISLIACPNHVARILRLEAGSPVWRMKKVRKHQGSPLGYYVHFSSPDLCKGISKGDAEKESFMDLFKRVSGVRIVRIEQRLEAAIADAELSTVLHVRFGAPLLYIENVYFAEDDHPSILTQVHWRSDRCVVKATVSM